MEPQGNMEEPSACVKGCALFGSAEKGHLCPNCCDQQPKKPDLGEPAAAAESTVEKPVGTKRPFYFPRDAKVVPFSGFGRRQTTTTITTSVGPDSSFFSGKSFPFPISSSSSSSGSGFLPSVDRGFFPTPGRILDPSTFTFGFVNTTPTKTIKKEQKNCGSCKRRVGLLGFKCRCKKLFCDKHRYPEEHRCSFDYKEFGRRILEEQNPVLESVKLENRV